MDIRSKGGYLASAVSNFAPHKFVFDGVECGSMEGLLQSFKFDKLHVQVGVCKLSGMAAKVRGEKRNKSWRKVQKLWWRGKEYDRHGAEYQNLLDRAFDALSQNNEFREALLATSGPLTHKIGLNKKSETILTEQEFCSRLEKLRIRFRRESAA